MAQLLTNSKIGQTTIAQGGNVTVTLPATAGTLALSGANISADNVVDGTTNHTFTATDDSKLAGIESGATADQSAAEILTALLTVDTNTSGLNAQYLAGLSASTAYAINTIVARDANGYIYGGYFNSNRANETSAAASYLYDSGDGWIRKKSLVNARAEILNSIGATCRAHRNTALNFVTATETKIALDFGDVNTNTGVFTVYDGGIRVNVAGTYIVSAKNSVTATGTTGRLGVSVMQNTTQYLLSYISLRDTYSRVMGTITLVCAANDVIYLYGYQNSGATRALGADINGNWLEVTMIA